MLRCKEVTRLCASEELRVAPLKTRLGVRLHLMLCRHCRRFVRELRAIGAAARRLYREEGAGRDRDEILIRGVVDKLKRPER